MSHDSDILEAILKHGVVEREQLAIREKINKLEDDISKNRNFCESNGNDKLRLGVGLVLAIVTALFSYLYIDTKESLRLAHELKEQCVKVNMKLKLKGIND